jgi:hypothetical protein
MALFAAPGVGEPEGGARGPVDQAGATGVTIFKG